MWTPRRIGLLFLGLFLTITAYLLYSRLLGWLDGLPQLPPSKQANPDDGRTGMKILPPRPVSPTELRLIEAFGPDCKELTSVYPTKLEFRNGESSVVIAAGPFPIDPNSPRISLVPFSVATFGKPKPINLRQPGEVVEVSTFHADKAVLEFDRPIITPQDMNKAKLVRMELISDPEEALPDPRRGKVHVTNNQRSADPNQKILLLTPGPVYYRDAKAIGKADQGPDIWTDAPVEVIDRDNLPRAYGGHSPQTRAAPGSVLRDVAAVNDILTGWRLPPPTVSAVGMRLYMEQEKEKGAKPADPTPAKRTGPTFGGVRRMEFSEKVLINLWVDSHTSILSPAEPNKKETQAKGANPLDRPEPPIAAGALLGGFLHGMQTVQRLERALLQIETLGPFAYDSTTNTARFDVVAQANPNVPNDVQVTRILPRGGRQELFSQVLEIELNGTPENPPPATASAAPPPKTAPTSGPSFKRIHAWTTTPTRLLTITAEEEQLQAYGSDLVHEQAEGRTILQGVPLYAVRGPNVLTAGSPGRMGKLVMEPGPGPDKKMTATVLGPGRIEMYDAAAKARTLHAGWQTSLTNTKEKIDGKEVDLLTFTDEAYFEDTKADYWLRGKVLKLWLAGQAAPVGLEKPSAGAQPRPQRIQAVKDVTAHSGDFDVEWAEHLNVIFQDGPPAAPPVAPAPTVAPPAGPAPAAPASGSKAPAGPAPKAAPPAAPPPPPAPKPPMKLRARTIDSFVLRTPQPVPAKPAGDKADDGGSVKYELKTAHCEDQVAVHQDPTEPSKPRGVDIVALTLDIKSSPGGSEMIVTGTDDRPGEVHYEGTSIVGPKVFIDQLHNRAIVTGRGVLQMPASSDLNGAEMKQPRDVVVHWRDRMQFEGALKKAEFFGKVQATQVDSWVKCHTMTVGFDRPVYFNQLKKPAESPAPGKTGKDGPKIQSLKCYPVPGDSIDDPREAGNVLYNEVVRDEVTGAVIKSQLLESRDELILISHDRNGEAHNNISADGPGTVKIWQPGQKDMAEAPAQSGAAPGPKPAQAVKGKKEDDTEMKLTIVNYGSRMTVEDKKVFQKVVFHDNVRVIHVPTDKPNLEVELHRPPPGTVLLTCTDTMTLTSHKMGTGPSRQGMEAVGNAYIRTDEYEGWGETIEYDGRLVILNGSKAAPARIIRRHATTDQSARIIKLDRPTNRMEMVDAVSGSIASPVAAPPTVPPLPK